MADNRFGRLRVSGALLAELLGLHPRHRVEDVMRDPFDRQNDVVELLISGPDLPSESPHGAARVELLLHRRPALLAAWAHAPTEAWDVRLDSRGLAENVPAPK